MVKFPSVSFRSCCVWMVVLFTCFSVSVPAQSAPKNVLLFHLIDNELWGEIDGSGLQGVFPCKSSQVKRCEMFSSDVLDENDSSKRSLITHLREKIHNVQKRYAAEDTLTLAMYNIHTWKTLSNPPYSPNKQLLPAMYSLAESEESHHRFGRLFFTSFPHFDGNSTTNPLSSVPRTYFRGWNMSDFLPTPEYHTLINGSTFIASTCHAGDGNNKRMHHVRQLMEHFRVDSLGKCLHTKHIPEGIAIQTGGSTEMERLRFKREAMAKYKFYLAFENTNERGYVTEKVFDALYAGVIPVYLGSKEDCQALMPSGHSVIYVDDFDHDMSRLGKYLTYLTNNQTAYEAYREWRHGFDGYTTSPLLTESWPCRLCNWVVQTHSRHHTTG